MAQVNAADKLQVMDGRNRGINLRGSNGQFVSRQQYIENINAEIDKCLKRKEHYAGFLKENPDLRVLMDVEDAKIAEKQKEISLVNNSNRGINSRVKAYEEAMKKQGMSGTQLKEQVARYRQGLLDKRKAHFDYLRGQNNARLIAQQKPPVEPKPSYTPFWKTKLGKGTKYGLIAAGAVLAGATLFGLFRGCNKSSGGTASANDSIPANPVSQPAPQPAKQQDEVKFDTIYAKKGDCYWNYAEEQLNKEGNKSIADTDSRTRTIMADNGAKLASDSIHSDPMLKVGDPVLLRKSYN